MWACASGACGLILPRLSWTIEELVPDRGRVRPALHKLQPTELGTAGQLELDR